MKHIEYDLNAGDPVTRKELNERNKERKKEMARLWAKNNRERATAYQRERRRRLKEGEPKPEMNELQKRLAEGNWEIFTLDQICSILDSSNSHVRTSIRILREVYGIDVKYKRKPGRKKKGEESVDEPCEYGECLECPLPKCKYDL